ncbi:BatD family protein [Marinirhabdus gelatinilytica]|uniref:Oxygen tolerance protein BatD n=1 Tax=Marinirhabdus gelatinilytica TaxID=1703343 RepID=A0A370QJT5_9FLAO|nr:BatD family protein [Marinirhabdus gelatinilytica]RDK88635.1 oxygen tolerance protein BatD [Marinirhabdus gelatinilytica]
MKKLHFLFLVIFVLVANITSAQVTFEAKVSKKKLGLNERLRVDFEMNQDGDNFNPPSFEGFRVVGGPNQAISNSYFNGKRSYSKTYSYFLSPLRKGSATIGQATIEIDGETYKTTPVSVTITDAVKLSKDGSNAEYLAEENVHLVAEVSKTSPYLSEAITVTYKLYVSHDVSITSNWREVNTPKYADFWSQNINTRGNYKIYEGKYNGEEYRYVILRSTVLYPQKTGELDIEPLTLDIPIDVRTNKRDIFGRQRMARVNKTVSAGSRTINVKPLPVEGKPDNFTGAVGDFQFQVHTNKNTLDANESLELTTKISGKGNLKLFDLPNLKLPSALEVYTPERDNQVTVKSDGMRGTISEKYTVVPQFKGNYPIRPITFSYFNPKTERYETLSSEEIVINVENGPVASEKPAEDTAITATEDLDDAQFKFIKLDANLEPIATAPFFKSTLFWSLLGGPMLLIPLFIVAGKKRRERLADVEGMRLRKADRLAKKYLGEAKKNMNDRVVFYEALERAFHNYLKAKLNIETSDFSKEKISALLTERQVQPEVVSEFIQLLKSCEYARYTPTSQVAMQQDYEKAARVISTIDKQIR